jgi:hypothetical protein
MKTNGVYLLSSIVCTYTAETQTGPNRILGLSAHRILDPPPTEANRLFLLKEKKKTEANRLGTVSLLVSI